MIKNTKELLKSFILENVLTKAEEFKETVQPVLEFAAFLSLILMTIPMSITMTLTSRTRIFPTVTVMNLVSPIKCQKSAQVTLKIGIYVVKKIFSSVLS